MKNIDFSKIATWLYGLAAVVITSAANTCAAVLTSFVTGGEVHWNQLAVSCGVSGIIAASLYLKTSPLPPDPFISVETETTQTKTTVTQTASDKKP